MKHIMRLHNSPFQLIKNGSKTIEMRLNDEKRQELKFDDTILFINRVSEEELETVVTNLYHFKDFKEMYLAFDKVSVGYGVDDIADPKDMEQYYSNEDILKYGTLGIEIKVLRK